MGAVMKNAIAWVLGAYVAGIMSTLLFLAVTVVR